MMHVPYKGSSLMMTDIVSGNVNVGFSAISTALGLIESGKVKVLAVAASERSPILPNVPTLGDTVLGYTSNVWFGLSPPAGTHDHVTPRLAQALRSYFHKHSSRPTLYP